MKTTLSDQWLVALPVEVRELDGLQPGQTFEVQRLQRGEYLIKATTVADKEGIASWLRSCPSSDWFEPIASESTDTL